MACCAKDWWLVACGECPLIKIIICYVSSLYNRRSDPTVIMTTVCIFRNPLQISILMFFTPLHCSQTIHNFTNLFTINQNTGLHIPHFSSWRVALNLFLTRWHNVFRYGFVIADFWHIQEIKKLRKLLYFLVIHLLYYIYTFFKQTRLNYFTRFANPFPFVVGSVLLISLSFCVVVFAFFFLVLFLARSQCCVCLWIIYSLLSFQFSLAFIDIVNFRGFQK